MRPIIICERGVGDGEGLVGSCDECGERVWLGREWRNLVFRHGAHLCCCECAAELFVGEIPAAARACEDHRVFVSGPPQSQHARDLSRLHELGVEEKSNPASPFYVACPRCAAGRREPCRGRATFHPQRLEENRERLEALRTWAVPFPSPCCDVVVWLVYRTTEEELEWTGVPCLSPKCERTYSVRLFASEQLERRLAVDRIHPGRVQMLCWGAEEQVP